MIGLAAVLLWYTYDDHLASLLNLPEVGQVPRVVWFIFVVFLSVGELIQFYAKKAARHFCTGKKGRKRSRQPNSKVVVEEATEEETVVKDTVDAMVSLGQKRKVAQEIVAIARNQFSSTPGYEQLVQASLKILGANRGVVS